MPAAMIAAIGRHRGKRPPRCGIVAVARACGAAQDEKWSLRSQPARRFASRGSYATHGSPRGCTPQWRVNGSIYAAIAAQ